MLILEKENKDLKDQILILTEQLEFLTNKLKSKSITHRENFEKVEKRIQEITEERNSLKLLKEHSENLHKNSNIMSKQEKTNFMNIGLFLLGNIIKNNENLLIFQIFSN